MRGEKIVGAFGNISASVRRGIASRGVFAAFTSLAIFPGILAFAQSPAPPVLNSPYICPNGLTYTVTTCKPYRADQWCETVEKQNGNLVTTMDSAWTQMTGRLAGCKVAAPAQPAQGAAAPPAAAPSAANAQQTFNPPYLKEFPTPDQVMAQVKGSSAQDTAYRQLTALHEFGQMIAAMAGPRVAQNQITPDEARLITNYFNAYTNLAKATPNPQDAYINKPDFTASLFATFNMPTAQHLWQSSQTMAANQPSGASSLPPTNDPTVLATRRCFELGGSTMQCVGTGLSAGFQSLIGINTSALTSPGNVGLVVFGTYNAAGGLHFNFGDGTVDIGNCGQMVQGGHRYTIQPSGNGYSIKIDNQPQPLLMTLIPKSNMAGPASQDITGQRIIGYEVVTNLKTGASTRTPQYGPVTVHCSVGPLSPGPAVAPDQGIMADLSGVLSIMPSLFGGGPDSSASQTQEQTISPGPRVVGSYAGSGGLKIQFNDGSAVIDCAQAHVMAQYDVSNQGGVVTLALKSPGAPFSLRLQANGALAGTGSATINGKLMTALDSNNDPVLSPTSATCPLDNLTAAK